MKAISLLLLRLSTGIYLILWGVVKFNADRAAGVSDRFYGGAISGETISLVLGCAQIGLGVLVVLGLFRIFAYWGQVLWYLAGIIPIIVFIVDPLGLYLVDPPGRLTFFPSTTLLFASLIMVAFMAEDTLSVDGSRRK